MKTAWLSLTMLKELQSLCSDRFPLETGGLLLGYWADNGEPVINSIIGPGPNAKHALYTFEPDYDFHDIEIDKIYDDKSNRNYYLGDWHCHPYPGLVDLSAIDIETVNKINNEVSPRKSLMMILGGKEWEIVKLWEDQALLYIEEFKPRA